MSHPVLGSRRLPFVIAEVGSNWSSFEEAMNSVSIAAAVGADAVKFQLYTEEALYGVSIDPLAHWRKGLGDTREMIQMPKAPRDPNKPAAPGVLSIDWLPKLKEKADACGIEFMCSAFSPELVVAVDPYVQIHKVASAELTHLRILERLRSIRKPVLLSTGASGLGDIARALQILEATPVTLLYCVAAYPARSVRLELIPMLAREFGKPVGFSDHTTDITSLPTAAVKYGACVIEKHFTAFPELSSPDREHSLTPDEFKLMVQVLRGDEAANAHFGPVREEIPMLLRHNRRLIATRDISSGETFQEGVNFGIYRSLKDDQRGLHPFVIDRILGRKATKEIHAGDGIGPGDFE
jgi:N,N'-diacetyllegionaminate synthase